MNQFQIFEKKKQYNQVAVGFKKYFQNRSNRIARIQSPQSQMHQKLGQFKNLIDDERFIIKKIIKKPTIFIKEKPKQKDIFQNEIRALSNMIDGLFEWDQKDSQKVSALQEQYQWDKYVMDKKIRLSKQMQNSKEVVADIFHLKEKKSQKTKQRKKFKEIQSKMNWRRKNNEKVFSKTCQASPSHSIHNFNKNWLQNYTSITKPFNFFFTKKKTAKYSSSIKNQKSQQIKATQNSKMILLSLLNSQKKYQQKRIKGQKKMQNKLKIEFSKTSTIFSDLSKNKENQKVPKNWMNKISTTRKIFLNQRQDFFSPFISLQNTRIKAIKTLRI